MTPSDLLAFEAAYPSFDSDKQERIHRELGITPTRYVILLHRAAESFDGITAHPMTARRMRERARSRAAARAQRNVRAAA